MIVRELSHALMHADAEQVNRLFAQAIALHEQGQLAQARALYERALELQPRHCGALNLLGAIAADTGQYATAVELIDRAIAIDPARAEAYYNRGVAQQRLHRLRHALESYDKAIALKPGYANAHYSRGLALQQLGRCEEAVESYDRAIALKPDHGDAHNNRGAALRNLRRYADALESFDAAIALQPDFAEAHNNRGAVLRDLARHQDALDSHDRAVALRPDYAEAYNNRANVLGDLRRYAEALQSYDRAIALKPDYVEACVNRGAALRDLKQYEAALKCYDEAIALDPDCADAHNNRGNALSDLKRYAAALESYERALSLRPGYAYLPGILLHTKMLLCDWSGAEARCEALVARLERGERTTPPFPFLAMSDRPSMQRRAAEIYAQDKYPGRACLPPFAKRPRRSRIRIGYFSADFRDHAIPRLAAELFEKHDRTHFDVIAFSLGPDADDPMRGRLVGAFGEFIDVRDRSDCEVALLAREREVDIAVDLNGYTNEGRPGIFAARAAPLQVNYLGYPGTTGAPYIDYVIADPTLVPEQCRRHFSEKIAYLPNSYQPNDTTRRVADETFTRGQLGLPESGFVFCCFNNSYKINASVFSVWMRILRRVDGSVLWLLGGDPTAAGNLRREAARRGVRAERLVFAERMPLAQHLARHRAADLFLDTFPYNAHTTASDALWAGLPVLTRAGEAFASRVAASLLNAVRLPQLVTSSHDAYEALAVELASNPPMLARIRETLARDKLGAPLFDIRAFTAHIESAYSVMYERYQAGLPPEHIHVSADAQLGTRAS